MLGKKKKELEVFLEKESGANLLHLNFDLSETISQLVPLSTQPTKSERPPKYTLIFFLNSISSILEKDSVRK